MIDRVDKNPARAQSAQLPLGSGDDQDPRIQKLLNKMSHKPQLVDSELLRQSAEAAGQALNVVTKSARPAHVAAMDAFRPTAITEAIATLAEQFKRPANPSQPRRPVIPAPMQEPSTVQPRSKETTTPERDAEPTPDSPAQAPTIPRGRGRRRRGVKESQPVHEPDDLTSPVDPRVQRLVDQELFKIFGPGKDGQSAATPLDESDSHPDEEMQMMESAAEDEVPRRGRLTRQKLAKLARLERLQEREAQRQERLAAEYDEADNVDAEEPEMEHNGEAEEPDNPFDAEEQLQAMHQQLAKARQVKTRQIRARIAALRRQGPDQPSEDTPAAAREAYAAALAAAVPKASMAPELDDTTNEPMHDDELAEELTMAERDLLSVERSEQLRERRANADDPTSMSFKRRVEQEYMDTFDLTGDWSLPVRAQREVRRAIVERIRNEEKSGMQLRLGKLRLAESEEALSLQRAKDRRSQMIANALLKATLKIIVHDSRIPAALRQAVEKSQMEIRGVHVSPDYRLAKLYWRPTSLSSPAQVDTIRDLLTANTSHLRFAVQEKLNLKYSPELRFVLDSAEEDVDQVSAILDRATREDHDASSKPKLASDPSLAIGSFRRLSTPRQS
ncbi:hypothetical protein CAOG_03364 [Capsaspora owczarzaki ATCC 30864]|nr:hypothetical protein CAOG_03364 [Capsaspora owczarzaki ATCC 30864]|eukprot:XP_004364203.2 hypothetical protein CAOG_03364 [Capsaspora owczarzaki ATCC 30864]